ncbi:MAG: hypothetical protein ABW321_15345 [Polyangiales bacterium]
MLIRSTRQTCFVFLQNGLTLELVYSAALIGADGKAIRSDPKAPASQGVWLIGGSVLFEVKAGQA